ncbi:tetraacyldisaccharide 4'-kinase [Dendrosporobacter sp. 1207_IL3150]|uniref:tetraacyldisaccharide 4'-kinase n=1 Tax=Dendrosporobacter sp. 1207_IL3150 TaxID=3084054 RepID=UPI002FD89AF0
MQFLYNIVAILLVVLALPVFVFRMLREDGFAERVRQSFGLLPEEALAPVANKGCIWLHAASVGEIVAASPIVKEFRREMPDSPILVSVVTSNGYAMAKRIVKDADSIIYFPLDLPWLSESVVRRIMPRVFLPVETELWPNFLKAARNHRIPVMMVNGRISDKSVKRYHYLRSILNSMIGTVVKFCMQSKIDADHIIRLGADPKRVVVTGNTKFDQTYTDVSECDKQLLRDSMGLKDYTPIVVAGSTHPGEEEAVFAAFVKVKAFFPTAKLILAPREILRADEIVTMADSYQVKAAKRTVLQQESNYEHDVVVLDTIGELGKVYSLGDIIYVGGSLVARGGHNILEPAAHGKPIIVGPHMFNFKDTYALFSERSACLTVHNADELTEKMLNILQNDSMRQAMSNETLAIINENKGASRQSAIELKEMLLNWDMSKESRKLEQIGRQREAMQTYLYKLVHGDKQGILAKSALKILYFLSLVYGSGVSLILLLYKRGILKRHRLNCRVISLGNITVGGTGKTPTAQLLAAAIRDMGYRVVILNRGYRAGFKEEVGLVSDGEKIYMSVSEAGDEAYLLAKNLPGVPVVIGRDRTISGEYAVQELKADVVILDDGYQHWKLARDLDIVLIDALNVFGNSYMLPRGTLREPLSNLSRASVCLLTKVDQATDGARNVIRDTIALYNKSALVVESIHSPKCFIEIAEWYKGVRYKNISLDTFGGQTLVAFSAIGNPTSFEQTITDLGPRVVDSIRFPDHHDYTMAEMHAIMQSAVEKGADALVTTEKDAVKIPAEFIHSDRQLPVYVLGIEVQFLEGYDDFMELIKATMK